MRFLPVGEKCFIVELQHLDKTLLLHDLLIERPIAGLDEIIPAACTLLISFDPSLISRQQIIADISTRDLSGHAERHGEIIEIPVHYNGEDLSEVAQMLGISIEDVIHRHVNSEYVVAFTGFAPGFAYLVNGDPIFNVARRKTPRTRIPAGSVALAGNFSGIYPQSSPGGWQLIGTTPVPMFDLSRTPPALLQPGMRVYFKDASKERTVVPVQQSVATLKPNGKAVFKVIAAPMPILYQDRGRHNVASQGVAPSGALDLTAMRDANRLVGNAANSTVLEISLGGLSFNVQAPCVIALTGATASLTIKTSSGKTITALHSRAIALEQGDDITIGYAKAGAYTYLAIRGGFDAPSSLGSTSTDTLSLIGPKMIGVNDTLYLKNEKPIGLVAIEDLPTRKLPESSEEIILDVVMGPRTDWFTKEAIELFSTQIWDVTASSNRIGARLMGQTSLTRLNKNELPSEGTVTGALQVPPNGQPVLFLKDRPLTGGYPVIAVIANHHLDLAGQLPVNAKIRFRPITEFLELLSELTPKTGN